MVRPQPLGVSCALRVSVNRTRRRTLQPVAYGAAGKTQLPRDVGRIRAGCSQLKRCANGPMRLEGLEPPRACAHTDLNRARRPNSATAAGR